MTPPDLPCAPYSGPDGFAFVSYAHADAAAVYAELARLSAAGCRVWFDRGIRPSSEWTTELADAITRCSLFVVFLSPEAVKSPNVLDEIHFALKRGKPFLAIHLEPTTLPAGLEFRIDRFQAVYRHALPPDRYAQGVLDGFPPEVRGTSPAPALIPPPQLPVPTAGPLSLPAFHYGSVVPPDFFIDREEELDEAARLVASGQGFLLVGNRRSGKTSFCTKVIHQVMGRPGNDVLGVYLNLQQCVQISPETFLTHTLLNIVGEMARQVFRCKYGDLLRADPTAGNDRLRADREFGAFIELFARIKERTHAPPGSAAPLVAMDFIRLVEDLLDILRAKRWRQCSVFFDEANRLPTALSVELLTSHQEALAKAGVTSIYAASPEMERTFTDLRELLGHHLRLGPFRSPDDLHVLLARYCGGAAPPIAADAVARLWACSGGVPYLIQLIAGGGFKAARDERAALVLERHVEAAYQLVRADKPHLFGPAEGRG